MSRRIRHMDFDDLFLPDGRRADSLRLIPLYAELQRLNVVGINTAMGKADLLETFRRNGRRVAAVSAEPNNYNTADATIRAVQREQEAR